MSADTDRLPAGTDAPQATFLARVTAWVLAVGGAVGLLAAATLTVEKINLLNDPDYVPTCSINPILSCGSVMTTPQAAAFGFPNPLLGIAGFAVVATIGVVLLAGARLPGWFWGGLQAGVTFGVIFVHWLIYQSLYVIGALCPYCMVVWVVTIAIFVYTTLRNLRRVPPSSSAARLAGLAGYHSFILVAWYTVILLAVLVRFWDYWSTLL
ncbi:vitamin K epoxide reductase family protein [Micromonospora craniellae]|uniref:Vitamin K epoxide reductase n=1 Tax=Micromonospora craniellae TaxID=2294034 RepID=A0A372G1T8_9ACTN|nr:vitamin K epoxide reductase family protein [Micromonospora craniellae]QOC92810.1 vitamin K epoxide reductase family protein [Micromonospora craniellae]RFS46953.1 Vitamin K epoxide reductase [Micromonospora craniellae]